MTSIFKINIYKLFIYLFCFILFLYIFQDNGPHLNMFVWGPISSQLYIIIYNIPTKTFFTPSTRIILK